MATTRATSRQELIRASTARLAARLLPGRWGSPRTTRWAGAPVPAEGCPAPHPQRTMSASRTVTISGATGRRLGSDVAGRPPLSDAAQHQPVLNASNTIGATLANEFRGYIHVPLCNNPKGRQEWNDGRNPNPALNGGQVWWRYRRYGGGVGIRNSTCSQRLKFNDNQTRK